MPVVMVILCLLCSYYDHMMQLCLLLWSYFPIMLIIMIVISILFAYYMHLDWCYVQIKHIITHMMCILRILWCILWAYNIHIICIVLFMLWSYYMHIMHIMCIVYAYYMHITMHIMRILYIYKLLCILGAYHYAYYVHI